MRSFFRIASITLLVLVLILLVINVSYTKYIEKDEQPKNRDPLSGSEINEVFNTALKNFGFNDNWIVKKKLPKIKGDSLFTTYSIKVPKDVPIHSILLELRELFWNDDVDIIAEEITPGQKSLIKLNSASKLKLAAELAYDENIFRQNGTVSFLVKDLPLENDELLNSFLDIPELYYVVLVPSDLSKQKLNLFAKSGKRFALILNDQITELNYKLSGHYSDDKIKKSVKEIVAGFYNAAFILIDDQSELSNSKNMKVVKDDLEKRKIKLIHTNSLIDFTTGNMSIENKFDNLIKNLNPKDEKVVLISASDYAKISSIIPAYRKSGYRFIYPGDIVLRINE